MASRRYLEALGTPGPRRGEPSSVQCTRLFFLPPVRRSSVAGGHEYSVVQTSRCLSLRSSQVPLILLLSSVTRKHTALVFIFMRTGNHRLAIISPPPLAPQLFLCCARIEVDLRPSQHIDICPHPEPTFALRKPPHNLKAQADTPLRLPPPATVYTSPR